MKACFVTEKRDPVLIFKYMAEGAPSFTIKLWKNSLWISFFTFLFFVGYVFILDGDLTLLSWSKVIAGTSGFLLAYSLSLSTIGYYFNFLDSKVIYRKYLGLMGYYFALFYSAMLLFVNPDRYFYGFFEHLGSGDFVFGLSAMAILTVMALISNNKALKFLGPVRWRAILRLGYLAFFLLVVRGIILEGDLWQAWLTSGSGLPPVRFLLSVVALFVIFSHYSIYFLEWWKKKHQKIHPDQPVPQENSQPAPLAREE